MFQLTVDIIFIIQEGSTMSLTNRAVSVLTLCFSLELAPMYFFFTGTE